MRLRDTAVRRRAPLVGGYGGQKTRDWAHAAETPIRVQIQPDTSVEYTDQQQLTVTRWLMWAGPSESIETTDRFEWSGRTLEVDGEVREWRRGSTVHHLEVVLKEFSEGEVADG